MIPEPVDTDEPSPDRPDIPVEDGDELPAPPDEIEDDDGEQG